MKRNYASATAFRRALEDRLATAAAKEGVDVQRLRRQVAFDRFLCRLFDASDAPWVLKGGYAMELRIGSARTTRDIDLGIRKTFSGTGAEPWDAARVVGALREAARRDLQDHFVFLVGEMMLDLDAAPYGGARFPVEARMDGRSFAKFHVDVSAGDVMREPYEFLEGRGWLGFAGISTRKFPSVSREEQFAEKLHAYTRPREVAPNSRVRDLVDMTLLAERGELEVERLKQSIRDTFRRRKTHELPKRLAPPPEFWAKPFAELAAECDLEPNMTPHFESLVDFLADAGILQAKKI
ncbi:MAG: nucleotidyl transferase AbiEii/AbiGii toxin family protein [Verrucomicrobia bacterium]|nr:nucleotidyl transferase AbiEii/AbiGii toxin family protein [Verrucomicrobiota bacterium]